MPIRIFTLWVQLKGKPAFYEVGQRVESLLNELCTNMEQQEEHAEDRAPLQALGGYRLWGNSNEAELCTPLFHQF